MTVSSDDSVFMSTPRHKSSRWSINIDFWIKHNVDNNLALLQKEVGRREEQDQETFPLQELIPVIVAGKGEHFAILSHYVTHDPCNCSSGLSPLIRDLPCSPRHRPGPMSHDHTMSTWRPLSLTPGPSKSDVNNVDTESIRSDWSSFNQEVLACIEKR